MLIVKHLELMASTAMKFDTGHRPTAQTLMFRITVQFHVAFVVMTVAALTFHLITEVLEPAIG